MIKFKELTTAAALPVSVAEAKTALRVVDVSTIATRANRSMGSGDSELLVLAKQSGSIGNQYSVRVVVAGNNTSLSCTLTGAVLTINAATSGIGAATSTVNDIIAEMYATPTVAAVFDATGGAGNGTGVIAAAAQGDLSAGVDSGDDDAYLTFLIQATTDVIESITGKAFIERTFAAYYDDWADGELTLPIGPVQSVEHVYYLDQNEVEQDIVSSMKLENDDDEIPAKIEAKFSVTLPVIHPDGSVRVEFTAGYGASSSAIPAKIRQCILFLVGHWYANREPVINGTAVLSNKVPNTFDMALNSFRMIAI